MIDKTRLHTKIQETAAMLFKDIQVMNEDELNGNLRYFAEKAKDVAESILEDYIFSVVEKYTEGSHAISDENILSQFINFSSGYQQQMLLWINDNRLTIKEVSFKVPNNEPIDDESNMVSPTMIMGVGTALAVGLYIFTNVWVALASEIITLVIAKKQKNRIAKQHTLKQEIEKNRYEATLRAKKDELVNGMIAELEKWLDLGEDASNKILTSFGI